MVSNIFYFYPYLGRWNLTNIFQLGWNHQLVLDSQNEQSCSYGIRSMFREHPHFGHEKRIGFLRSGGDSPKVPQSSLGIFRLLQLPPPLQHPTPLKNPTTENEHDHHRASAGRYFSRFVWPTCSTVQMTHEIPNHFGNPASPFNKYQTSIFTGGCWWFFCHISWPDDGNAAIIL